MNTKLNSRFGFVIMFFIVIAFVAFFAFDICFIWKTEHHSKSISCIRDFSELDLKRNKWFSFEKNGQTFIYCVLPVPFYHKTLMSGPPVYIFDDNYTKVDFSIDSGDDSFFHNKWNTYSRQIIPLNILVNKVSSEPKSPVFDPISGKNQLDDSHVTIKPLCESAQSE